MGGDERNGGIFEIKMHFCDISVCVCPRLIIYDVFTQKLGDSGYQGWVNRLSRVRQGGPRCGGLGVCKKVLFFCTKNDFLKISFFVHPRSTHL